MAGLGHRKDGFQTEIRPNEVEFSPPGGGVGRVAGTHVESVQVDTALHQLQEYCREMTTELHSYFGSRGVNYHFRELLSNLAKCWNWSKLAYEEPDLEEVLAFVRVFQKLRPTLRGIEWPTRFEYVNKAWPKNIEMAAQYRLLCKRVRFRMSERIKKLQQYTSVSLYRVRCLRHPAILAASLGLAFRTTTGKFVPGVFRVLLTILRYSDPPAFSNLAGRLFWTSPRSLCQPGCSLRWSSPKFKNSVRYKNLFRFSGTVGQIAQIGLGDMKTFVVQVVDEKRTFSPGALAASFDTDAYWHVTGPASG